MSSSDIFFLSSNVPLSCYIFSSTYLCVLLVCFIFIVCEPACLIAYFLYQCWTIVAGPFSFQLSTV